MALKNCKECGKEVSTKADTCPNCGAPIKAKGVGCVGCLTILILIGVILFAYSSLLTDSNTRSNTKLKNNIEPKIFETKGNDIIMKLTEKDRRLLMRDVLANSGKSCNGVDKLFFRGFDADNAAYWSVGCFGNQDYQVQIPDDPKAKTKILECELLKSLNIDCWTKF